MGRGLLVMVALTLCIEGCQEKIRIVLQGHAGMLFARVPGSIVDNHSDSYYKKGGKAEAVHRNGGGANHGNRSPKR